MFNNLSLKTKLLSIVITSLIVVMVILLAESIVSMKDEAETIIKESEKAAYEKKEKELENYVSLAYKTVESYYARTAKDKIKGEVAEYLQIQTNFILSILEGEYKKNKDYLSDEEMQVRLKSIINSTKFEKDGSGYFFAYDTKGITIANASKPQLEGKNLLHVKDANGVFIVKKTS